MKRLLVAASLLLVVSILSGYRASINVPPSKENVDQVFLKYYECIKVVTDYMASSGYRNMNISQPNGTVFADLEPIELEDACVADAIVCLYENAVVKSIYKTGDTVVFLLWAGLTDISCGLAYQIYPDLPVDVQFLTELETLSKDKWYYYVADYEKWRIEHVRQGTEKKR